MWSKRSRQISPSGSAPGSDAWRRRLLERAGFGPKLAEAVARDRAIDLHAALDLVERGCRPDLAVRILAPLEDGDPRC
jgi:hypothetical protein